jgi:prepilin-type N-terminal cleavage/methylation domain-containing protein
VIRLRTKLFSQKGFTLIELLVVIAIIGLLASVVLLSLNSARAKSRDAKRVSDVRQLVSAMELYYNDNSDYPASLATLVSTYIGAVPTGPTPADGSCSSAAYTYTRTATGAYTLTFCLGGTTGGYSAGVHTASQAGIQ